MGHRAQSFGLQCQFSSSVTDLGYHKNVVRHFCDGCQELPAVRMAGGRQKGAGVVLGGGKGEQAQEISEDASKFCHCILNRHPGHETDHGFHWLCTC